MSLSLIMLTAAAVRRAVSETPQTTQHAGGDLRLLRPKTEWTIAYWAEHGSSLQTFLAAFPRLAGVIIEDLGLATLHEPLRPGADPKDAVWESRVQTLSYGRLPIMVLFYLTFLSLAPDALPSTSAVTLSWAAPLALLIHLTQKAGFLRDHVRPGESRAATLVRWTGLLLLEVTAVVPLAALELIALGAVPFTWRHFAFRVVASVPFSLILAGALHYLWNWALPSFRLSRDSGHEPARVEGLPATGPASDVSREWWNRAEYWQGAVLSSDGTQLAVVAGVGHPLGRSENLLLLYTRDPQTLRLTAVKRIDVQRSNFSVPSRDYTSEVDREEILPQSLRFQGSDLLFMTLTHRTGWGDFGHEYARPAAERWLRMLRFNGSQTSTWPVALETSHFPLYTMSHTSADWRPVFSPDKKRFLVVVRRWGPKGMGPMTDSLFEGLVDEQGAAPDRSERYLLNHGDLIPGSHQTLNLHREDAATYSYADDGTSVLLHQNGQTYRLMLAGRDRRYIAKGIALTTLLIVAALIVGTAASAHDALTFASISGAALAMPPSVAAAVSRALGFLRRLVDDKFRRDVPALFSAAA